MSLVRDWRGSSCRLGTADLSRSVGALIAFATVPSRLKGQEESEHSLQEARESQKLCNALACPSPRLKLFAALRTLSVTSIEVVSSLRLFNFPLEFDPLFSSGPAVAWRVLFRLISFSLQLPSVCFQVLPDP